MKNLNLKKSIFELCTQDPELLDILYEIGFTEIVKPGMLNTVGRFMTLPKGASLRKISMDDVRKSLAQKGYLIGDDDYEEVK